MTTDIAKAWEGLLINHALAFQYPLAYQLDGDSGAGNPVLDQMLPSLLHIKAVAILDAALRTYLAARRLTPPKKVYGDSLEGRIRYLSDSQRIADDARLHTVRLMRNDLAHEISDLISWDELAQDVDVIEATLQHLGFVGPRAMYEPFGERSAARESADPEILAVYDYVVGVRTKDDGQTLAEVRWSKNLHRSGA